MFFASLLSLVVFIFFTFYAYSVATFLSDIRIIFFVAILLSLILYILISMLSLIHNDDSKGYYTFSESISGVMLGFVLAAGFHSTGMFMGDAALAYNGLFAVALFSLIQSGGYFIGNAYLGRYMRRLGVGTIPDYIGKRFCSGDVRKSSSFILIVVLGLYTISVMLGMGTLISYISGIHLSICISIALFTVMICVLLSGNRGVFTTGIVMVLFTIFGTLIGVYYLTEGFGGWNTAIAKLVNSQYHDFVCWRGASRQYYSVGKNYIFGIIYAIGYFLVTCAAPWQTHGFIIAKKQSDVSIGALIGAILIFIICFFALIAAVLVNLSPVDIPTPAHALISAPWRLMPLWAGLLVIIGILSAGLSSASLFVSFMSTGMARDLIGKKDGNGDMSKGVARRCVFINCFIIWVVLMTTKFTIFGTLMSAVDIAGACYAPRAYASVWSKKVTRKAAMIGGNLAFVTVAGLSMFYYITNTRPYLWLTPLVTGLIVNIVTMAIVSHFTEVTPEEKAAREALFVMTEEEKTPEEMTKNLRAAKAAIWLGPCATVLLVALWAYPVFIAK